METIAFDITIETGSDPVRVTLRDGRLDLDRSTEAGGFAAYLMTLKKGTPGGFGHPINPDDVVHACDADYFLRRVFGPDNVDVVSGQQAIAQGYAARPPKGAHF